MKHPLRFEVIMPLTVNKCLVNFIKLKHSVAMECRQIISCDFPDVYHLVILIIRISSAIP